MSKKIECRLSEQLYIDLKAKCHDEGITVTDAVISNVSAWLYNKQPVMTEQPSAMLPPAGDPELETPVLRSCPTMPEPEIVRVGAPCEAVPVPDVPIKDDTIIYTPDPIPIIKTANDVRRIVDSLPMRAYFRPCSKASQTHSAGKAKGKS